MKPRKIVSIIDADGKQSSFSFESSAEKLLEKLNTLKPLDFTVENEIIEKQFMHLYGRGDIK